MLTKSPEVGGAAEHASPRKTTPPGIDAGKSTLAGTPRNRRGRKVDSLILSFILLDNLLSSDKVVGSYRTKKKDKNKKDFD